MTKTISYIVVFVFVSCSTSKIIYIPPRNAQAITGSEFYKQAVSFKWYQRDSLAVSEILAGNIPSFLKYLIPIKVQIQDSLGKIITAKYFVTPDYLSIGTNNDWTRIPLSPMAAQKIADSFNCFLPTKKMVDDIYKAATVKLEPVPMYAFRDSTITMYQHHLIVEGQRQLRKGLVAGIKKDVVISERIIKDGRQNRVAIYGWHKQDGKAIQPLYVGHVNWYIDYSHGSRLVYKFIYVNGKPLHYVDILKDKFLKRILCNEDECNFYRYSY